MCSINIWRMPDRENATTQITYVADGLLFREDLVGREDNTPCSPPDPPTKSRHVNGSPLHTHVLRVSSANIIYNSGLRYWNIFLEHWACSPWSVLITILSINCAYIFIFCLQNSSPIRKLFSSFQLRVGHI